MANRIPNGANILQNSGTGTTSATATLTSAATRVAFVSGAIVSSSGATAAGTATFTITGTTGGTISVIYPQVAIANNNQCPLELVFNPAIPATGPNVNLVGSVTTGAGTTNTSVTLTGYMI